MPAKTLKKVEPFICYIRGIKYNSTNTYGEPNFDIIRCAFANVTLFLSNELNFGYFCLVLLLIIIIISIFGKIKENYKWFILNQAVWDLLMCFEYIDNNKIKETFFGKPSFWDKYGMERFFPEWFPIGTILETQPYASLFLLCLTRFICLFFMNFYEKLTRKRRIIFFILSFNFITLFVHIDEIIGMFLNERQIYLEEICKEKAGKNLKKLGKCFPFGHAIEYNDFLETLLNISHSIFNILVQFKSIIFLSLSIFFTVMIIFKIAKQAKFQLKHNRQDFLNSFRVSFVMALQTFLYLFVFIIYLTASLTNVQGLFNVVFSYSNELHDIYEERYYCYGDAAACIKILLPKWMYSGNFGLTDSRILQTIVQIRIFIESFIVLSIMTGYREAIFKFIKFVFKSTYKPLEKNIQSKSSGVFSTEVTSLSSNSSISSSFSNSKH